MTKKLVICISILLGVTYSFAQNFQFLQNNSRYVYVTNYLSGQVNVDVDTIHSYETSINDTVYITDGYNFVRNQNDSIYVLGGGFFDEEAILYDFNLEIGDYFYIPIYGQLSQVISKSQIQMLNGEFRTQLELDYGGRWIEGIGDVNSWFYYMSQIGNYEMPFTQIVCYGNENEWIYKAPFLPCDCDSVESYYLGLQISKHKSSIFLHHINKSIQIISLLELQEYRIYASNGILVKKGISKEVYLDNFPSGIYYMQIITVDGNILNTKFSI